MKLEIRDNLYKEGEYQFPEVETRIITMTLSKEEFLLKYMEYLGVEGRYQRFFVFILNHLDPNGLWDRMFVAREIVKAGYTMGTAREYTSKLLNHRAFNYKLLLVDSSGKYKVNPKFFYHLRKPMTFIVEYKTS